MYLSGVVIKHTQCRNKISAVRIRNIASGEVTSKLYVAMCKYNAADCSARRATRPNVQKYFDARYKIIRTR